MNECKKLQEQLDLQGILNGFCEQDGTVEYFQKSQRNFKISKLLETDFGRINLKLLKTAKWFVQSPVWYCSFFFRNGHAVMEMEAVPSRVANHLTSTTSPRYHLGIFGGPMRTTSPHLKNIEVVSKQPHLTSKKSRLFQNNLTSPRKNRGCFETTSPHLKKIEVIFKQPHLTSRWPLRWYSVTLE
jgi:hypothetical protein